MRLLLVGNPGGTNVADSFLFAARQRRIEANLAPASSAFRANRLKTTVSWRLLGHRPPNLEAFSQRVLADARAMNATHVVATGLAPVTAEVLQQIEARRIVFLTDDPWHPLFKSKWFMEALVHYDVVYTPRRANMDELARHGCADVRYLPFGYDPRYFYAESRPKDIDVFFAGGAEQQRVDYLKPVLEANRNTVLAGDRWDRYAETRDFYRGHFDPEQLRETTAAAHVNICLVRSSNRDGHVMRTFEIPACGGCMVAEDTAEHRALFGPHGDAVLYFNSPHELQTRVQKLLKNEKSQQRLALEAHRIIVKGKHTYADRLSTILEL